MLNTTLNARIDDDLVEDVQEFRTLFNLGGLSELKREIKNESLTEDINKEFVRLLDLNGNEVFASDLSHWKGMHTFQTTLQKAIVANPEPILETIQFRDKDETQQELFTDL